jgi:hypothetical protein
VSVQGVVDLAVIRDDEIWVLDFKTDRVLDVSGKIEGYTPQLRLYALALERIYGRPVTQVWLTFLRRAGDGIIVPLLSVTIPPTSVGAHFPPCSYPQRSVSALSRARLPTS